MIFNKIDLFIPLLFMFIQLERYIKALFKYSTYTLIPFFCTTTKPLDVGIHTHRYMSAK